MCLHFYLNCTNNLILKCFRLFLLHTSIFHTMTTEKKMTDTDEQFCLKWNDFSSNMAESFKGLREEKAFCDVMISCEGQQLQAHKMIVSACSPFFKKMIEFQQKEKHPIIILKDVSFLHMSAILEFMYHGEVSVTQEELPEFLKTAEKLEIKGLAEDEKEVVDGGEKGDLEDVVEGEAGLEEAKFLM